MRKLLLLIYACTFVLYAQTATAQEHRRDFRVGFRLDDHSPDPAFEDNADRLAQMIDFFREVRRDSTATIIRVELCGATSPDGSEEYNRRLAIRRSNALERAIRSEVDLPDSLFSHSLCFIPWDRLKQMVEESQLEHKKEVLAILKEKPAIVRYYKNLHIDWRILKLKRLHSGTVWKTLIRDYFPSMRYAEAAVITRYEPVPAPEAVEEPAEEVVEPAEPQSEAVVEEPAAPVVEPVSAEEFSHRLTLKTNALGWALAVSNIAVEVDVTKHLSFSLPIYYSAWNYFKSTIKFRAIALQPELRWWPSQMNNGFFAGAHFGVANFNVSPNDDYRYQNPRKKPLLGGGLSVGYRLPISKNKRWTAEFSVGAGCYSVTWDTFRNYENGKRTAADSRTYWGLDQAAVSFGYSFDLKKKGGAK